jgi:AcrR family transcriptional regulator
MTQASHVAMETGLLSEDAGGTVFEADGQRDSQCEPREPRRKRNGVRTQQKILFTAGRHFARRGYSAVTLKDIADDVGVTPAMVVRYFGSKRALFEAVARTDPPLEQVTMVSGDEWAEVAEEWCELAVRYWQDPDLRTPALALLRSLDIDGGKLFQSELQRRVVDTFAELIRGPDADVRRRLALGIGMGFGIFSTGLLFDSDLPPLSDDEIKRFVPYMVKLFAICIEPPETVAEAAS